MLNFTEEQRTFWTLVNVNNSFRPEEFDIKTINFSNRTIEYVPAIKTDSPHTPLEATVIIPFEECFDSCAALLDKLNDRSHPIAPRANPLKGSGTSPLAAASTIAYNR